MQLSRAPKTSDAYGRYYTNQNVAHLLISSLLISNPRLILDLGSGDGMLINEARRQWSRSRFVTADIDITSATNQNLKTSKDRYCHYTVDVLDESVEKKIGVTLGSVDLALCNPPYLRPVWREHFSDIMAEAGLSHVAPKIGTLPAEVLFVAQNLRFLKKNGKLGLILPDGLVAGEKFSPFRLALATDHRIEKVIELPRRIFKRTDAKAHILILSKGATCSEMIDVLRFDVSGKLSEPIKISRTDAAIRMDYSHWINKSKEKLKTDSHLRDAIVYAKRGKHSSAMRKAVDYPIFHTTDMRMAGQSVPKRFVLSSSQRRLFDGIIAETGDILIARVGRNLSSKVCRVRFGPIAVSDCVIVLRPYVTTRKEVADFLSSPEGCRALDSIAHGVGAKFITISGLLGLPFPELQLNLLAAGA